VNQFIPREEILKKLGLNPIFLLTSFYKKKKYLEKLNQFSLLSELN
jgi:hypothetical protein